MTDQPDETGRDVRRSEIIFVDPHRERPVSQYSPEGEIRMMGDFAAALTRRPKLSRPLAIALVVVILLPVLFSALALLTFWF